MASPSTLAPGSRYLWRSSLSHPTYARALYQCKYRSLSYRDFLASSPGHASVSKPAQSARLNWGERLSSESTINSSPRVRVQFSARRYRPFARELLRGLWSLDKDPVWLLVDQLVATGKPHNMAETCPDFLKWQHVVCAPDFFTAIASLLSQGCLPRLVFDMVQSDDGVEEKAGESPNIVMPTWVALYLLCSKLDNPSSVHAGISFAISQIDVTPPPFRMPLLIFAMCAASEHNLTAYVPPLLQTFQDCLRREAITALGSRDIVFYQYNVFLMLISRFPLVPQLATHVDLLLRYMQARGIPLEPTTARQLIVPHKTASFLVRTVQDTLASQQVAGPSAALSVSLTRYFSKSRNQREAAKHLDASSGVDPLAHAKTYILSFRDVSASLAHLGAIQSKGQHVPKSYPTQLGPAGELSPRSSLASKLLSRQIWQVRPAPRPLVTEEQSRHIYTSMLFAAALSKTISVNTFSSMVDAVHAAHGGDRVMYTVVLVGLLRRRAWHEARQRWKTWEKLSMNLQRTVRETEDFFGRRERTFGDATTVRDELNLTEHQSDMLRNVASRMKVDSTALAAIVRAVAGPDNTGLLDAFEVMDGYAMKTVPSLDANEDVPANHIGPVRFRPHDVCLTSRVLNCFLMRVFAMRRPDIIFRFWEKATAYYGVEVSVPTLELVLRSARVAFSLEHSLMSVVPGWLLRGTLRDTLPADNFGDLGNEIRWMLSPECRPGTRWNGLPAWRVARHIFREDIIFANWPWLRDVAVPAQPVRGDGATSHLDAIRELAFGDTQARAMGPYPHLIPRARTFREYVLMLSRVQRASEIPQVLAWMRALQVRPSRHMLSLFLALWSNVGLASPADDIWAGGEDGIGGDLWHGGEYGKLVVWLTDWLGKDGVPSDAEAVASLKYVREIEQNER